MAHGIKICLGPDDWVTPDLHLVCARCRCPETPEMVKRWRDFCRPYCDPCLAAMKHEGHGPGSGLMVHRGETHVVQKIVNGRMIEEKKTIEHPPIPIEKYEFRCRVCFPR